MKHIVWTRIDDRLIHGQVMTQWIQYTEANEVLIIDDGVAKDSFLQMVMKSSVPGKISLKVLNKGINVFLRVIVTEPEEDIAKYL